MRYLTTLLLCSVCMAGFATAGIAERMFAYQIWLYPAVKYCGLTGIGAFVILAAVCRVYKSRTDRLMDKFTGFLRRYSGSWGIITAGLILAVPNGILSSAFDYFMWILGIFPVGAMIIMFLIFMSFGRLRNKRIINKGVMKWSLVFTAAALTASALFIILAETGTIEIPRPYLMKWDGPEGGKLVPVFKSHPYDSVAGIWQPVLIYAVLTVLAFILVWTGRSIAWVKRKLTRRAESRE